MLALAATALVSLSGTAASDAHAQAARVEAVIHADSAHAPISPYLYGQFLEHIGGIVNRGLWAEMLEDRKFYAPVVETEPPPQQRGFGPPSGRRWTAVGPIEAITGRNYGLRFWFHGFYRGRRGRQTHR